MANPQDSLQVRVLRAIEELLNERPPDDHYADTNMVLQWMRLEEEARDELNLCMSELLADGYVRGKELRGGNKALDVTVTAITDTGLELLSTSPELRG
jgi:hypothetical protein